MSVSFQRLWLIGAATAAFMGGQSTSGQLGEAFHSPNEAAKAIVRAAKNDDVAALVKILGPSSEELVVTSDTVADRNARQTFARKAATRLDIVPDHSEPSRKYIEVGNDGWPLPIPLIEKENKWYFDVELGRNAIRIRRIGDNELTAINVLRGYVEAQYAYASRMHQYAQKFFSTPGQRDGLYWESSDPNDECPVAQMVARAISEGYEEKTEPFHGYRFRILTGQGSHARHGAMSYVDNGKMTKGFALIAWPAHYGSSGVMTFIVDRTGIVYQKDLGEDTQAAASNVTAYDPDETWLPAKLPGELR